MKFFTFVLILFVLPFHVRAQDICDVPALADGFQQQLASAGTIEELTRVSRDMQAALAACYGLAASGTGETVVDPIDIPAGLYRLVYETEASAGYAAGIIHTRALSGECDASINMFSDTSTTAETLIESDGCRVLFEVSNVTGKWTIHLERLD